MILTSPAAPLRFVGWTAERVLEAAERDYYDLAAIRGMLTDAFRRFEAGEMSEEEFDGIEDQLLERLAEAERFHGLR
ncbi:gas vesicle protein GvpG [Nocardiopsis lambiniae]|uniref:Gas vesicle protein GvpG n=1 Tax=Nocardiopsis lambiniae TaxID=3075539 RepID=A0ABU2M6K7_9ACTN|nr:gas vesicle protein GvpG [Nocardiopsis sp. DSM 44743]MDT0328309.1 gas vesicle protein GvpG [Nocardiopsis sp. DSM 44743]